MADFILDGERISPDTGNWQERLQAAHDQDKRLLCSCVTPHPEMCVALINGSYFLRRMPNTGANHGPDCPSFEPPAELSGYGELAGRAVLISESGDKELKLAFSLTASRPREAASEESGVRREPVTAKAPTPRMSLLAVLHLIWTEAQLNRWHPRFADKRTWFVVRREAFRAVEHLKTRKVNLHDILFIPPVWSQERKDELSRERAMFFSRLHPTHGKAQPIGLLLAEVKSIDPTPGGARLKFKHLPDQPFLMHRQLMTKFEKVCGADQNLNMATPESHLMALATFTVSAAGICELREIATMAVTRHWLPFATTREAELIEALSGRAWIKTLRFDLTPETPIASGLLTDVTEPVALFCPSAVAAAAEISAMEEIAAGGRYPFWMWKPTESRPPLPPAKGH